MPERPVRIGAGSWLGHGTVVLPGATIGRHVVVGANSVVRGELPDFCVAAGNPAKVIKTLRLIAIPSVSERSLSDPQHRQKLEVVGWGAGGHLVVGGEDLELVADRDAVDGGLGERRRSRRPAGGRRSAGGPRCRCGSRPPTAARGRRPWRRSARRRRRRRASARRCRSPGRRGRRARRPSPGRPRRRDAGRRAPRARSSASAQIASRPLGPGPVADLVDRLLGGEEQRPDPERGEAERRRPSSTSRHGRRRRSPVAVGVVVASRDRRTGR